MIICVYIYIIYILQRSYTCQQHVHLRESVNRKPSMAACCLKCLSMPWSWQECGWSCSLCACCQWACRSPRKCVQFHEAKSFRADSPHNPCRGPSMFQLSSMSHSVFFEPDPYPIWVQEQSIPSCASMPNSVTWFCAPQVQRPASPGQRIPRMCSSPPALALKTLLNIESETRFFKKRFYSRQTFAKSKTCSRACPWCTPSSSDVACCLATAQGGSRRKPCLWMYHFPFLGPLNPNVTLCDRLCDTGDTMILT